jgi:hypothetical protein
MNVTESELQQKSQNFLRKREEQSATLGEPESMSRRGVWANQTLNKTCMGPVDPRRRPTGLVTHSITVFRRVKKKKHEHTGFYICNAAGPSETWNGDELVFSRERNRETSQAIGPVRQFGAQGLSRTCAVLPRFGTFCWSLPK